MDSTPQLEMKLAADNPNSRRIPTDETGTADHEERFAMSPERDGHVQRYWSRDAHKKTALLINIMNCNFGDIEHIETNFERVQLANPVARRS